MPQEPDRKIEELLKAYGKKRREDGGAPLQMHPATRKLLQDEVARLRPKPASGSASWFQLLIQFWPRIGFAVSIVLALGVVVWMLGLNDKKSTEFAQAARQPATELSSRDELQDKDVALQRETLDRFSAPERKPTDRLERVLEESRSARPAEAPVIADEMMLAETDVSKRFDKQAKLKDAAGVKYDQQPATRDQSVNGRSPSSPAPVTQRQKNAPASDSPAPTVQTIEIARNPIGGVPAGGRDVGGAAVQNRLGENRAGDNPALLDSKTTRADSLGLLLAPTVATNTVVAYSINGTMIAGAYSVQDSSGFSNALFGNTANYYTMLQPAAPIDISTNLSLFADSRANAPNRYFQQSQDGAWNEASTLNKKAPQLRAAEPTNLSLARSQQPAKQQLQAEKELSARSGVNKDQDGLALRGLGTNVPATTWHFVAEPLQPGQAGKELETVASSTEQLTARLRAYGTATKTGVASGPLAASTVLNSFRMDVTGDRIRLTDADGSVYEGQLAARNEEWGRKAGEGKAVREAVRLEDDERKQESTESRKVVTGRDAEPGSASFRVSGTNRSLNQLVVIDAVLNAPSEVASGGVAARFRTLDPASATTTPAPSASPAPTTPAPTSALAAQKPPGAPTTARQSVVTQATRIQGKARIGGTNEVSINAIRVIP